MRHLFGLAVVLISFSVGAQVHPPYSSLCQFSTHSDSYGRGIESAFTGENLRIRYNDENCYQLGFEAAQEAIRIEGRTGCKQDFDLGYPEGFSASANAAGVQCYNLGYSAGRATLDVGARDGDAASVGTKCVSAYKKGRSDGRNNTTSTPDTASQPELSCYELGHFEASIFN